MAFFVQEMGCFRSTVTQLNEHSGEIQLTGSGLEAERNCDLHPALHLEAPRALEEESRVAAEIFGRRERDRIGPLLDRDKGGGGKAGDAMCERCDEFTQRGGGQAHD
jgi:hypothetical protein